jgi:hypothetical protein
MLHAGFLLGLFFEPEDVGDIQNFGRLTKGYMALHTQEDRTLQVLENLSFFDPW